MNKMQHKWYKEIKAWADGAEIEGQWQWAQKDSPASGWRDIESPDWESETWIYRIKPQPKEPQYLYVYFDPNYGIETKFIANKNAEPPRGMEYLGKIKLEQDDE